MTSITIGVPIAIGGAASEAINRAVGGHMNRAYSGAVGGGVSGAISGFFHYEKNEEQFGGIVNGAVNGMLIGVFSGVASEFVGARDSGTIGRETAIAVALIQVGS